MSRRAVILVVDDNPGDILLIEEAFRSCASEVAVHEARNAVQGFDYLQKIKRSELEQRPAVVMLDLNMPIFSGVQVLEFIKHEPMLRDIPVVIWTSTDRDFERDRCLQLGADEFVVKPDDYFAYLARAQDIKRRFVGCCHEVECALTNPAGSTPRPS